MTAAERILSKALAASKIDSSQWASIQAGLRDRAFFISTVMEVRVAHETRELSAKVAAGELSASEFRDRVRKALSATGYEAKEDEGTIKDLTTRRRLDLILQTNVRQARGYVQHLEATSQGALLAEPAYELIRVRERAQPRDWITRWKKAGGKIYPGARMIALKTDPIWVAISRFGNPFPPFDFGSGMGIRGIRRSEALQLGVITPETPPQKPPEIHFNGSLQAEVPVRDDSQEAEKLRAFFGDQIDFRQNTAHWRGHLIDDVMQGKAKSVTLGRNEYGEQLKLSHNFFREHLAKHFGESEKDPRNVPLTKGDYELLPSMWREPDRRAILRDGAGTRHLTLDAFDHATLHLFWTKENGIRSFYKTKSQEGA